MARCVLDSLSGRRANLWIVGADTRVDAPALAECDEVVDLPGTDDVDYVAAVSAACQDIDLLIPGRDPDVALLAPAATDPSSPVRMACAPPKLVNMTRDKWETARWCAAQGVPFAPTVATGGPESVSQASQLIDAHGFPLICKPRSGSASAGVTVVLDRQQLAVAAQIPGMILQPFLDPPSAAAFHLDTRAGLPLFWEVPCPDEPAVMGIIGPRGEVGPHLCFTATHRLGRNEDLRASHDATLDEFAEWVVPAFRDAGWRGPLNLQVRRGRDGWQIIEVNPRFTGGTAARLHLGLDEVGWVLNRWLGRDVVPEWERPAVDRVERYLQEFPVPGAARGRRSSSLNLSEARAPEPVRR